MYSALLAVFFFGPNTGENICKIPVCKIHKKRIIHSNSSVCAYCKVLVYLHVQFFHLMSHDEDHKYCNSVCVHTSDLYSLTCEQNWKLFLPKKRLELVLLFVFTYSNHAMAEINVNGNNCHQTVTESASKCHENSDCE